MSTTSVVLLLLPCSNAHFCINRGSRKANILTLKELCEDPPPPHCSQLLTIHKTSMLQVGNSHAFKWFPEQSSSFYKIKVSPLLLTVDGEQYTGIAHPHHVLGDAGKQESIVLTGDIHQGQIDGMNIGPVEVGLKIPEKHREISVWWLLSFLLLTQENEDQFPHKVREGLQNPRTTGS